MLGLLIVALVAVPGLALGYFLRASAASAADAAALACASQAVVTQEVDARGVVYAREVAVDPVAGPAAAARAWAAALGRVPAARTAAFAAQAAGAECRVRAAVGADFGLGGLLGRVGFEVHVAADARAVAGPS